MSQRYFKAEIEGRTLTRGTGRAEGYAFCFLHPRYVSASWTSRRDLIPAGARFALAVEISAAEYRAAVKAGKGAAAKPEGAE